MSVSCTVEVIDAQNETNATVSTYRLIYDTMELSGRNPAKGMGTVKIHVKLLFYWVLGPLVLGAMIFLLALRYCFKRVSGLPHMELVEDDPVDRAANI